MPLVTSDDYDFIRRRIDTALNASSLPDPLIASYVEEAEEWVAARVTDLEDLNETDERYAHAKRAALYYLASLIAASWTPVVSESIAGAGSSWSKKVTDPLANAARLLARAEGELDAATAEVEVSVRSGRGGSAMTSTVW